MIFDYLVHFNGSIVSFEKQKQCWHMIWYVWRFLSSLC